MTELLARHRRVVAHGGDLVRQRGGGGRAGVRAAADPVDDPHECRAGRLDGGDTVTCELLDVTAELSFEVAKDGGELLRELLRRRLRVVAARADPLLHGCVDRPHGSGDRSLGDFYAGPHDTI